MLIRVMCIVATVVVMLVAGCSSGYRAVYDIDLIDTERPSAAEDKFGQQIVKVVGEVGKELSHFEDDLVVVQWAPATDVFELQMTNKTDASIQINWDDGAYVDEKGTQHRIIHSKVIHEDKEKPQKPTVVEPGASISEAIRSADNVYYEQGINARYRERPFFPETGSTETELTEKTTALLKKTVKIKLPIDVSGEQFAYVFVFELGNIVVEKTKKDTGEKKSTWVDEDQHTPEVLYPDS